jgi:hypothetical protein
MFSLRVRVTWLPPFCVVGEVVLANHLGPGGGSCAISSPCLFPSKPDPDENVEFTVAFYNCEIVPLRIRSPTVVYCHVAGPSVLPFPHGGAPLISFSNREESGNGRSVGVISQ